MRKADVVIGEIYEAKVSGRLVPVRVVKESLYGGYNGLNLKTGRRVRLRTAARLRRSLADAKVAPPVEPKGAECRCCSSTYTMKRILVFEGCGTRRDKGPELAPGDVIGKFVHDRWSVTEVTNRGDVQEVRLTFIGGIDGLKYGKSKS